MNVSPASCAHAHRRPWPERWKALAALTLLVPSASLGVACGMIWFPGSTVGLALFAACKVWLIALPLFWHRRVERVPIRLFAAGSRGWKAGVMTGLVMALGILCAYALGGHSWIDQAVLARKMAAVGLAQPWKYAVGAIYWIVVNAWVEEYVWRWFCVRQCQILCPRPASAAVMISAFLFTLHHLLAIRTYARGPEGWMMALGVFVGGMCWSGLFARYRSIYPAYFSHALADASIFALGAWMLFFRPGW